MDTLRVCRLDIVLTSVALTDRRCVEHTALSERWRGRKANLEVVGKPPGLETGIEPSICKPSRAGASPNQGSKRKLRLKPFMPRVKNKSVPEPPTETRLKLWPFLRWLDYVGESNFPCLLAAFRAAESGRNGVSAAHTVWTISQRVWVSYVCVCPCWGKLVSLFTGSPSGRRIGSEWRNTRRKK